jgi:hypothetical protein
MRIQSTVLSLIVAVAGSICMTAACSKPSSDNAAAPATAPAAAPAQPQPAAQPAAPPASEPAAVPPAASAPAASPAPAPAPAAAAPPPAPEPAPASAAAPEVKPTPPPPPPPRVYTLKAGTPLRVWTTSTLSTKSNKTGEAFSATLAEAIVHNGWVIAKKGASVRGVIVDSDPGGRVKGTASLSVTINGLTLADGRTVKLAVDSAGSAAKSTKGKDAKKIGIAAGVGTAIGAIAGGGSGAAIGAAVGGGAGAAHTLATRGAAATIPAETELTFVLREPVTITEKQ